MPLLLGGCLAFYLVSLIMVSIVVGMMSEDEWRCSGIAFFGIAFLDFVFFIFHCGHENNNNTKKETKETQES